MGEACLKFDTQVTGGNVSFYNQNPDGAVYPTPTIGMVGVLDSVDSKMTLGFRSTGDLIYLIGKVSNDIHSSEYLHKIVGVELSPVPYFNLEEEFAMQQCVSKLIAAKLIVSAHDVSEGGLFISLLESSFVSGLGFVVEQSHKAVRSDAYWFGEAQGRVVVSVRPEQQQAFEELIKGSNVPFAPIGKVSGSDIQVNGENWGGLSLWKQGYDTAIGDHMH
jgi:phosphoribosylformylglycinamidine synthase